MTTFTALKVLFEPDIVLAPHVSLLSSPNLFQIHSFSNRFTRTDRFRKGSNLEMACKFRLRWMPTKRNVTKAGSTGSTDISSKIMFDPSVFHRRSNLQQFSFNRIPAPFRRVRKACKLLFDFTVMTWHSRTTSSLCS